MLNFSSALAAVKLQYQITGINGEIATNVKKRLDAKFAPIKETLDKHKIDLFAQQAENEIKQSVAPFGYFKPQVHSTLTATSNNNWFLRLTIMLGPRIQVSRLALTINGAGRSDIAFQQLQRNLPIKTGDVFTSTAYEDAKGSLVNLAQQRGYFDAKSMTSRVIISQSPYAANITLVFDTGPRYRFGPVNFVHTEIFGTQLSQDFLLRFVPFKEGDCYDNDLLNKLQSNLGSSGDFTAVVVTPQSERAIGKYVPITVTLTPSKSQLYNFGGGYGTDTGIRGRTSVKLRRLTDTGHYVAMDVRGAGQEHELDTSVQLSYNIPGKDPNKDLYKFSLEGQDNDDDEIGVSKNLKANASYTSEPFGWQQTIGLTLLFERSQPVGQIPDTSTFLIPNINWLRIKSDDPLLPNKGYRINLSLRGASRATLGSTDFFQAYLQTKWLYSFTDSFRMIVRGDIGTIAVQDTEDIPLSLRFFAGGAASVRGYHYNAIGKYISGADIAVASLELQHRLYKQIYLCAFVDAGNVSSSFFDQYNRGVGGGLVWRSPIGSFSLTLAQALDIPGKPSLVQFNMGADL